MIIVINSEDIEKNKIRADLGITYDLDVLRLIDVYRSKGLYVGSVVLTRSTRSRPAQWAFRQRLEAQGIPVYCHYRIEGYPKNIPLIVSDEGYGKNDYIENRPARSSLSPLQDLEVEKWRPAFLSSTMSTSVVCAPVMQSSRHSRSGIFRSTILVLPRLRSKRLLNPNDVNMIDSFHLSAYGVETVNYNRDIEIFPVLREMFRQIYGESPYQSPTDMGVNMAGYCIVDDEVCREASRQEIIRRYYESLIRRADQNASADELFKIEFLMQQLGITPRSRRCAAAACDAAAARGVSCAAIELSDDGSIVLGKTSDLLGPCAAVILNALKELAGIDHELPLISPSALEPIQKLKTMYFGSRNPRLHTDETLIALSISASTNPAAQKALDAMPKLRDCQLHCSNRLSKVDLVTLRKLGLQVTMEPVHER